MIAIVLRGGGLCAAGKSFEQFTQQKVENKMNQHNRAARLCRLFFSTLYISSFTFGGGFVIVTLMKKKFVDELHWITEEEMLEIVRESPYLQYFLGFDSFTYDVPFSSRSMERFRTRISPARVREAVALLRGFETNKGSKK